MNHTILATDEMKEQIEDLYLKAGDILEIAGTHKLRYSPWFRGIEREVERQMLWELDNPAGMPSPKIRRDWEQYRELQEEFYIRLSKGLYGSGLQGQRKVAAVLAHIWLTLHRQFGLGGEFLCWLDLRFHVFLPLTAREKEELKAQREAEDLVTNNSEQNTDPISFALPTGRAPGALAAAPAASCYEPQPGPLTQARTVVPGGAFKGGPLVPLVTGERERRAPLASPSSTCYDAVGIGAKALETEEEEQGVDEEQPFVPYVKRAKDWAPASLLQFLRQDEEEAEEAQPWPDNRKAETRRSP